MKTPEQWKEEMFVDLADTEHRTIAWIQSDAREGMVPNPLTHKLMPITAKLVWDFAKALAEKLSAAEAKYGYGDNWATPDAEDWPDPKCYTDLVKHLQKGDPRDVAIYCAFLWYHKLSTSKCLEMAGMVPAAELQAVEAERDRLLEILKWANVFIPVDYNPEEELTQVNDANRARRTKREIKEALQPAQKEQK